MANLGKVALAMLGILAYQNRDRLGSLLRGNEQAGADPANVNRPGGGGLLDQVADSIGSGGGLGDILDRFRNSGSRDQVDSWVRQGPNQPLDRTQIEAAIDPETIEELSRQTGLSREQLLERIAGDLPDAVDKMTPDGRLPTEAANDASGEPTLLDPAPPSSR